MEAGTPEPGRRGRGEGPRVKERVPLGSWRLGRLGDQRAEAQGQAADPAPCPTPPRQQHERVCSPPPPEASGGVGVLDLEVPGELIEVADVPEDHVPIAAEIEGQQVVVAEPHEEQPRELGHSLGYGGQAASQHLVQVLVGVLLRVQERVNLVLLPGGTGQGCGRADARRGCLGCGNWSGGLTSRKENSTAGTPAKAVKE